MYSIQIKFKQFLLSLFLLISFLVQAQFEQNQVGENQMESHVDFDLAIDFQEEGEINLKVIATIDKGWKLPSMREIPEGDDGPLPTEITFDFEEGAFEILEETTESEGIEAMDPIFNSFLKHFKNEAVFEQKIKINDAQSLLGIEIFFMICDNEKCLAPDTNFIQVQLDVENQSFALVEQEVDLSEEDQALTESLKIELKGDAKSEIEKDQKEDKSYVTIFFLGFIGGLIALLTPCVFPMIPLTVSFFTKGARTRKLGLINAIMYAAFILAIYLLLSIPFHLLDSVNPEILNNISTNTVLNIIFFLIFVVFAISFFGYFEITLPNSWSNRLDQKATSVGGVLGVFFMALTLALVSFSCTGPILGSLLGGSLTTDGGATQLTFGMGGFGLALALPFGLFALFPNWLNSLPKSGGWMNTLKVVLGFLELGLAFKFLSNADLVEHWGILPREVFIGVWIIIGAAMALYLFGLIRFPHDGSKAKLGKPRIAFGIITVAFVIYLIPGLTNTEHANLKLLSGFPPPLFYSIYEKDASGPLGLKAYKDFDEGVEAAKASGKPILLDFTGWACVNCRKMEEQVWSVPEVYKVIQDDYILISLYVDDREKLPEEQQFNYEKPRGGVKKIETIGDKWATFQTVNFQNNSQPYYVLMNSNFELLNSPVGYTPNANNFLSWLKQGTEKFESIDK